jgi:hypothetical protein
MNKRRSPKKEPRALSVHDPLDGTACNFVLALAQAMSLVLSQVYAELDERTRERIFSRLLMLEQLKAEQEQSKEDELSSGLLHDIICTMDAVPTDRPGCPRRHHSRG